MNKILIVDDFISQRSVLKIYLANTGIEFVEAENGKQAMEYLKTNQVDGVLTDLEMPEMDGLELIKSIRAVPALRNLPVIMITSVYESRPKAIAAGATAWVHKPYEKDYLLQVVQNAMGDSLKIKEYTVLLIDDVNLQTSIWAKTLKMDFFKFIETHSAQEGLNTLRNEKVDLIITDYLMPQVDGMRFVRKIKSMPEFNSIPIMMITTDEDIVKNPPSELVKVFKKPFNPVDVKNEMKAALNIV